MACAAKVMKISKMQKFRPFAEHLSLKFNVKSQN